MDSWRAVEAWIEERRDWFFDLVRIYLGVGLVIKAVFFIQNTEYLISLVERSGNLWFIPAAVAHYVIGAHLVGGLFLAIGFLTRFGALVQIPALVGAVFWIHLPGLLSVEPRQSLEFSALVLFLLVLVLVRGAGPLSVDARMTGSVPARRGAGGR
jgi:uncharacterized membrane protein YphA (DoxX/SURF4 family)